MASRELGIRQVLTEPFPVPELLNVCETVTVRILVRILDQIVQLPPLLVPVRHSVPVGIGGVRLVYPRLVHGPSFHGNGEVLLDLIVDPVLHEESYCIFSTGQGPDISRHLSQRGLLVTNGVKPGKCEPISVRVVGLGCVKHDIRIIVKYITG